MRQKPSHAGQSAPVAEGASTRVASEVIWALGSLSALNRKNFSAHLSLQEFPPTPQDQSDPSHTESSLLRAARRSGFRVKAVSIEAQDCRGLPLRRFVHLAPRDAVGDEDSLKAGVRPDPDVLQTHTKIFEWGCRRQ